MNDRPLGATGLSVTSLGLGTRGHRAGLRDTDAGDADRAVRAALDAGCLLIDCAAAWGESERLVGAAVRDRRAADRVVVTTHVAAASAAPPVPARAQHEVEASLRATRLEVLPVVWLDGWDDAWLDDRRWPELRGTLDRLVREGKVLAWGASADDPAAALRAVTDAGVAAIATPLSLFDRRATTTLVPAAAAAGIAVIARSPLAGGALAGEIGPGVSYRFEDERRRFTPAELIAASTAVAELAAFTRTVPPAATAAEAGRAVVGTLRRHPEVCHRTVGDLAVAYIMDLPGVTATLLGARTPGHVAAWWPTPPVDVPAAIRRALDQRTFGAGWPEAAR